MMLMHIEVITATPKDNLRVARLLQLYEHDSSEFFGADVAPDGLYRVMDTDALWQPGWHTFLVKVDDQLAGFAFVTRHQSYLGDDETYLMVEFFIMRKYRRQGVGEYVACTLFDRFPGRWEVSEWPTNFGAHVFWRRVIGRYTYGRFHEADLDTPRWRGLVQSFESANKGT